MNKKVYLQDLAEWNLNAPYYEAEEKFPFQKIIHQEILEKTGLSPKHKKILDAGCGVGYLTFYIQQKTGSQLVGFDFAEEMIKIAKRKHPKISFFCISSEKLPFKDNAFDAILAVGLLHHLKAQGLFKKSIKEFFRVLKPNGLFCALDRRNTPLANFSEAIFAAIKALFKKVKGSFPASSTTHEVAITKKDINALTNQGFVLTRQSPMYSLVYKILVVTANFIFYSFGERHAILFQKLTFPLALFSEKKLNFSWLSTEKCLVFKKVVPK